MLKVAMLSQTIDVAPNLIFNRRRAATVGCLRELYLFDPSILEKSKRTFITACIKGNLKKAKEYVVLNCFSIEDAEGARLLQEAEQKIFVNVMEKQIALRLIDLVQKIDALKKSTLPNQFKQLSFEETLLNVAYLVHHHNDLYAMPSGYMSKKSHDCAHSLIINRVHKYVTLVLKRKTRVVEISQGIEKVVYAGLTFNLNNQSFTPSVLHVPTPGRHRFSANTIEFLNMFVGKRGFIPFEFFLSHTSVKHQPHRAQKIVQPYIPECLENFSLCQRSFDVSTTLPWVLDIAYALKVLHKQKVVHQDLKRVNILTDGLKGYLIDFGLSHYFDDECGGRDQMFYGYYTAPEQIEEVLMENGAGAAGDMYALGCILHELFLGNIEWLDDIGLLWTNIQKANKEADEKDNIEIAIRGLRQPELRAKIQTAQSEIENRLNALENKDSLTEVEKFHLIIYRLIHPNKDKRLTAKLLISALEALQVAAIKE